VKVFVLHPDRDLDLQGELPTNQNDLTQDVELNTLLQAMADGDRFLFDIPTRALFSSLRDPSTIVCRQHVLQDCLDQPALAQDLYKGGFCRPAAPSPSLFGTVLLASERLDLDLSGPPVWIRAAVNAGYLDACSRAPTTQWLSR